MKHEVFAEGKEGSVNSPRSGGYLVHGGLDGDGGGVPGRSGARHLEWAKLSSRLETVADIALFRACLLRLMGTMEERGRDVGKVIGCNIASDEGRGSALELSNGEVSNARSRQPRLHRRCSWWRRIECRS